MPPRLRNLVLMGMGEPLHNYDAVMQAVDIMRDPNGLALSAERITLSTVGRGARHPAARGGKTPDRPRGLRCTLPRKRSERHWCPAAKKWPLDELMAACCTYSEQTKWRIFYEWTLIEWPERIDPEQARAVGQLLHRPAGAG